MLNLHRPNNSVNLKGTLTPDNLGNFGNTHYQYLRWAPLYTNIKNVNVLLAKIDDVPVSSDTEQALLDRMKAEAYFIRAYDYVYLTRAYGGLVLIDPPFEFTDDFMDVDRSGIEEPLAFKIGRASCREREIQ